MKLTSKGRFTSEETAALISILIVAVWMSGVLWFHLTRPVGAGHLEFVFLGALAPVLWILSILYLFRVRWSYLGGIFAMLVLFAGVFKALSDNTLFFSLSFYNLLTIFVLIAAALCIWFSFRAFRHGVREPGWQTAVGLGGIILLTGLLAWLIMDNEQAVQRTNAQLTLGRLEGKLAQMETLEEKINYLVEEGALPSAAVGIVVDDQLVWSGVFGEGATTNTRYNAGSIAKAVIATAVLQLYERGELDLDADVGDYLPFEVRHPDYPQKPVTPRMLLLHQSGLAHFTPTYLAYEKSPELIEWEQSARGTTIYGAAEPLAEKPDYGSFMTDYLAPGGAMYTPAVWTSIQPGTGYSYSTTGYDLLGYLVEEVSGQPLMVYMEENLFSPLGMENSGLLTAEGSAEQAVPYERVYGVLMQTNVPLPRYGNERLGGGGLATTAPDLAQFMIAHMNNGRHGEYQLLEPETTALMHRPAVESSADLGMRASGYGWTIRQQEPWHYWGFEFPMHGAQGHGGRDYGYRSNMYYVDQGEGGYGFVNLTNTADLLEQDMLWFFAIHMQLEKLLMDEAELMWMERHGR